MRFFFLAFVSAIGAVGCEKDQSRSDSTQKLTPASEAPPGAPAATSQAATSHAATSHAAISRAAVSKAAAPKANAVGVSEGENKRIQVEDREGEPMDDVDDSIPATDESGVIKVGAASPQKAPRSVGRAEDDPEKDEVDGEE